MLVSSMREYFIWTKKRKEQGINISDGLHKVQAEQRYTIKCGDLETKEVIGNGYIKKPREEGNWNIIWGIEGMWQERNQ